MPHTSCHTKVEFRTSSYHARNSDTFSYYSLLCDTTYIMPLQNWIQNIFIPCQKFRPILTLQFTLWRHIHHGTAKLNSEHLHLMLNIQTTSQHSLLCDATYITPLQSSSLSILTSYQKSKHHLIMDITPWHDTHHTTVKWDDKHFLIMPVIQILFHRRHSLRCHAHKGTQTTLFKIVSNMEQYTRRPPDHRKEMQTAVVWSCLPFIRSGQNHLAWHSERGKKTRQTEEEMGK